MKVAGIKMTDPWASRVLRSKGVESERVTGVPVEIKVMMERVAFEHHGSEKNYRPLLHLTGELQGIRPDSALPYGIDEVTFRAGLGPTVDAFYEFDDAQLTELVSKGYFTEGFDPPETMAGILWDLPTTVDALVMAPENETDTPVVFVTIEGQTGLALDADNSGYVLAGYFENKLTPEAEQERALQSTRDDVPTRSGEITDIFADVDFVAPEASHWDRDGQQNDSDHPVVRASIFDDLMAEFAEKLPAEDAAPEVDTEEIIPDPIEAIYNERIAPGVEKALNLPSVENSDADSQPDPLETAEQDEVETGDAAEEDIVPTLPDLYEKEDELGVVPVSFTPDVEPVWEPDQDPHAVSGDAADSRIEPVQAKAEPRTRRVQQALAHEKAAAAMERAESESGPELG